MNFAICKLYLKKSDVQKETNLYNHANYSYKENYNSAGKKGKSHKGTCIKDPWTKPKGVKMKGRRWGWVGWGKVMGRKWRLFKQQLKNDKK